MRQKKGKPLKPPPPSHQLMEEEKDQVWFVDELACYVGEWTTAAL